VSTTAVESTIPADWQEDPLAIYLIVNGGLGMSAGKLAAQAFQACQRLMKEAEHNPELAAKLIEWEQEGTRTCTRLAKTAHLFDRACQELQGATMIDEGLTEVAPGSATCFATWPCRRSELPRMLRHKNIPVLSAG
jgi:peptidyl-tRNA hydrolase